MEVFGSLQLCQIDNLSGVIREMLVNPCHSGRARDVVSGQPEH
jgi:hypothetical protein